MSGVKSAKSGSSGICLDDHLLAMNSLPFALAKLVVLFRM